MPKQTEGKKMIELNKRRTTKKSVFKMNPVLSKSMKMLFGSEEPESYNERLKKSAMRVIQADSKPFQCYDCGLEDDGSILEIHHLYEHGERNGNAWREIHGKGGAEFYRYILMPDVPKPELVLLCALCHAKRHKRGHNHE